MPYPPISALPAVPSRNAPSTFSALMDAFLAAFPQMRTEFNALAAYLDTLALATGPGLFQSGSAALPGIAFAGDTDTGLFRPAANQIGLVTGGAERVRITNAGMQVTGLLTGTAVMQSPYDTTAGCLAAVFATGGIFGWGNVGNIAPIANFDDPATPSGLHRIAAEPASMGTRPTGFAGSTTGALLVLSDSATSATQLLFRNVSSTSSFMWVRKWVANTSTWTPWVVSFDQANVLGTVSQSGGVPTGALMQPGSGAQGRFRRTADGEMTCRHKITTSTSAGVVWTYPSAFVEEPVVTGTAIATEAVAVTLDTAPGTTTVTVSAWSRATGLRVAVPVCITAEGRWSTMS